MGLRTCLLDSDDMLVADTSTIINLIATGSAADILGVLPCRVVAVDVIREELEYGRARGRNDANIFDTLVSAGLINVVSLGNESLMRFERLVVGRASETLDDGEAATIAYAAVTSAVALIDERKALRLCSTRFPDICLGSTVDVLVHPAVRNALGATALADAVFNALAGARMRVLPHHIEEIVALIGPDRAAECVSLPASTREKARARALAADS